MSACGKRNSERRRIVVKSVSPNLVRETVSESTSNFINNALYQTVSGDGGTRARRQLPLRVVVNRYGAEAAACGEDYLVSVIGYAPANNPQVLCSCGSRYPASAGEQQAHSTIASEIFSKIMAEVLPLSDEFRQGRGTGSRDPIFQQEEGIISGTATRIRCSCKPGRDDLRTEGGGRTTTSEFIDSGDEYS